MLSLAGIILSLSAVTTFAQSAIVYGGDAVEWKKSDDVRMVPKSVLLQQYCPCEPEPDASGYALLLRSVVASASLQFRGRAIQVHGMTLPGPRCSSPMARSSLDAKLLMPTGTPTQPKSCFFAGAECNIVLAEYSNLNISDGYTLSLTPNTEHVGVAIYDATVFLEMEAPKLVTPPLDDDPFSMPDNSPGSRSFGSQGPKSTILDGIYSQSRTDTQSSTVSQLSATATWFSNHTRVSRKTSSRHFSKVQLQSLTAKVSRSSALTSSQSQTNSSSQSTTSTASQNPIVVPPDPPGELNDPKPTSHKPSLFKIIVIAGLIILGLCMTALFTWLAMRRYRRRRRRGATVTPFTYHGQRNSNYFGVTPLGSRVTHCDMVCGVAS